MVKALLTKIFFLSVLLFIACSTARSQTEVDVIHLKDSSTVRGNIIEKIEGNYIKIQSLNGEVHKLRIESIVKCTKETVAGATIMSQKDNILQHDIGELGVAISNMALFNLTFSVWWDDLAFKLSNSFFGKIRTTQLDIALRLKKMDGDYQSLNIMIGTWKDLNKGNHYYSYFGLNYNFNFKGFYIDPGVLFLPAFMNGNIKPYLQVGYSFRFLNSDN